MIQENLYLTVKLGLEDPLQTLFISSIISSRRLAATAGAHCTRFTVPASTRNLF